MSFLIGVAGVVVVFGLVIFVHEFGHFIVAKKSGVKVERFSFGLGPEMVGFQWGETRYCLAWIPLGGEVRMAGEADFEAPPDAPPRAKDPREFFSLPWYRRIPIVLAGPAMNYVLAFVFFALVAGVWGDPRPSADPVIGDVMKGYPAHQAGLQVGDRILSLGGKPVSTWRDLAETIHGLPEKPVPVEFKRGDEVRSVTLTPRLDPQQKVGLIGVTPTTVYEKMGAGAAIARGAQQTWFWSRYTIQYLGEKIVKREKPDLAGPIGIASVVAKAAGADIQDFLYLIALISVGIGLFNLFPIPLLDGGHLMFYLWEGLTRKPLTRRMMQTANTIGLSFLLAVLIFATYSDVQRLRPAKDKSAPEAPQSEPARP
jgi:regulator of sigma E protease